MNAQKHLRLTALMAVFLAACGQEPPVRTVSELIENPILLEAAMVRCSQDRTKTRYEPECVNARQAVQHVEAKEEQARRKEAESRSASKRQALRRAQEAAAEARRRASEKKRLQQEAAYLAQFGVDLPPDAELPDDEVETGGNLPVAVIPDSTPGATTRRESTASGSDAIKPTDGGNAPTATQSDDANEGDSN